MKRNFKSIIDRFTRIYVPVLGVLLVAGLTARLLEIAFVAIKHGIWIFTASDIVTAISTDILLVILFSLPLSLVFYLLRRAGDNVRSLTVAIVIGLATIGSLLLSLYYTATLTPLGPEFWAYSFNEMADTVMAAESYIELKLAFLVLLTICFVILLFYAIKRMARFPYHVRVVLISSAFAVATLGTVLLLFLQDSSDSIAYNKLGYFVMSGFEETTEDVADYKPIVNQTLAIENSEFPLLKRSSENDVLGPFFKEMSDPPNIVFILVESLGGEFVGSSGNWTGFAPFIDSLASNGLYWENGLSMSGRTFGMIPSLLGSLPPGRNGFMDLGPDYPSHTSLIRMLGDQGYHTSFYSGYNTYFDGLQYFLEYQGTDLIVSKEWISSTYGNRFKLEENYWGYDDKSLFEIASTLAETVKAEPRLEIIHTLQSHSPFTVPDEQEYSEKFDERLNKLPVTQSKKESFKRYRSEFTTLLFTDDALRKFMDDYKKRDTYSNTVFIITGDHWLIPVPQTSMVSRYHVPIIFYSELIDTPVQFKSVNTHANIVPSLTAFLENSANLSLPDSVHWIGQSMDTSRTFRNTHSLPLMQNKNQLSDYISESYFLNKNSLYKMSDGLDLTEISNAEKQEYLQEELKNFKSINAYVTESDKLYPKILENKSMKEYEFITQHAEMFDEIDSYNLGVDDQFSLARETAFEGNYEKARAISRRLLLVAPDYHDVRILIARTYAWEGEYVKSRENLLEVMRRDPGYYDTYNALADSEYWAENYSEALDAVNKGLSFHPDDDSFLQKKIKILIAMNRTDDAKSTFSDLKNIHPSHENLEEFESQLF